MAKSSNEAYRISGEQLVEHTRNRRVIPLTLSADIALGGGIPLGATVLLGGKPKAGKTSCSLAYAANAQKLYDSKVFFFNIEGRLSQLVISQTKGLMLDGDHFEIVMPPPIEKDGKIIGYKKWPAERWWDEIGHTIENNPGSIIIVDSIANFSSDKEFSEDMGYQDRGGKNKLEAQFCRKYGDMVIPAGVTLFLLTQVQANTSGYGPSIQMKVGNHIKHQADVIIFAKNITKWPEVDGKILGHDIMYHIECSALGPPFVDMTIPLRYGEGIDILKDTLTHAVNWDIITRAGAWMTLPFVEVEENKFEYKPITEMEKDDKPVKVQGENGLRNWFLIRDKELKLVEKALRDKLMLPTTSPTRGEA